LDSFKLLFRARTNGAFRPKKTVHPAGWKFIAHRVPEVGGKNINSNSSTK